MTNEEIQNHIEQNCRNEHGEPMMDEQTFYEGAKWMRDQALRIHDVVGQSEQLVCPVCKSQNIYEFTYTDGIGCNSCGHQWAN